MKPSKKLMRDFAKVVLPDAGHPPNWHCWWNDGELVDLSDWQTVIELAQKWWVDNYFMWALECGASMHWRVINQANDKTLSQDKHLTTAIMKAVVSAAESEGK